MKPLHGYIATARARVAAFLALAMVFSLFTVGAGTAQAADHTPSSR